MRPQTQGKNLGRRKAALSPLTTHQFLSKSAGKGLSAARDSHAGLNARKNFGPATPYRHPEKHEYVASCFPRHDCFPSVILLD